MIDGKTRFGGLIGRNISFSLSPLIHNTAARHLGLNCVYLCFDFSALSPGFFTAMHAAENCFGFSITVPYKEKVAQSFADSGSCNTLSRGPEDWIIHSTDGPGFVEGMKEIDRTPKDFSRAIILGNGGAAKALIDTLLKQNPQLNLSVLRRDASKDQDWPMDPRLSFHDFHPQKLEELIASQPESLLIQSTSAPLKGDSLQSFVPALRDFRGAFIDLVYGKASALLQASRDKGLPAQDGLPMLIHQALLAQEIWWGKSAPVSVIRAELSVQGKL